MLTQRRSTHQPRMASSGVYSEIDAPTAWRDMFPWSRRSRSQPVSFDGAANPEVKGDPHEDSMRRETRRAEDAQRIRLDKELYRGAHIQSWSSDRNEQDDYDETDFSGGLSNVPHTFYNPRLERSKLRNSSSFSDKYPGENFLHFNAVALTKIQAEAERFWRAESHEWPRADLRGMYSVSTLYNKDTISRDNTIGTEERMDDLLACVGKRMMKTSFSKESRDESSKDGGGVEENTTRSGIHVPRANAPADGSKLYQHPELGKGYQMNSQLIETALTLPRGNNYQPVGSIAELSESANKLEHSTRALSPRPSWADKTPRRPARRPWVAGPEWDDISDDEDAWLRASSSRKTLEVEYER